MISEVPLPNHPSLRQETMNFYADILKREFGFDYYQEEKRYKEIGNVPGVYPDTLLFLGNLVKHHTTKNIIEFGSGFSTLFFHRIANGRFISYEENPKYLEMTQKLLNPHYPSPILINESMIQDLPGIDFDDYAHIEMVFIDTEKPLRQRLLNSDTYIFAYVPIVVVDDMTMFSQTGDLFRFMCKTERPKFFTYNGVGRTDRIEFVSVLNESVIDDMNRRMAYL